MLVEIIEANLKKETSMSIWFLIIYDTQTVFESILIQFSLTAHSLNPIISVQPKIGIHLVNYSYTIFKPYIRGKIKQDLI